MAMILAIAVPVGIMGMGVVGKDYEYEMMTSEFNGYSIPYGHNKLSGDRDYG